MASMLLLGAGNAGGWTPASLPGLAAWYTAGPTWCFTDAGATTPCGDGDLVYTWADRFGTPHNLVQATIGARPTLNLVSGKWVVRFDGIARFMDAAMSAAAQTWYAAINRASTTGNTAGISTLLSDSTGDLLNVRTNSATVYRSFVNGSATNSADSGDHSHSTGNFRINGSDGGAYAIGTPHYIVSKRTPTPQAYLGLRIARVGAAGVRWFDGDYYELFGTTDWSSGDQTAAEAYLAARIA